VGLWGGGGLLGGGRIGPGGRRGGGVPVRGAYAKTTFKKPRQANKKIPLGFLLFQVPESHSRKLSAPFDDTAGRNSGLKSNPRRNPELGTSHHITQTRQIFARV
jgi:hypothetical protein